MPRKHISLFKLRPAPRGSKAGWVSISGQVPPDLGDKLLECEQRFQIARTDLVHQALAEWVERRLGNAA